MLLLLIVYFVVFDMGLGWPEELRDNIYPELSGYKKVNEIHGRCDFPGYINWIAVIRVKHKGIHHVTESESRHAHHHVQDAHHIALLSLTNFYHLQALICFFLGVE